MTTTMREPSSKAGHLASALKRIVDYISQLHGGIDALKALRCDTSIRFDWSSYQKLPFRSRPQSYSTEIAST